MTFKDVNVIVAFEYSGIVRDAFSSADRDSSPVLLLRWLPNGCRLFYHLCINLSQRYFARQAVGVRPAPQPPPLVRCPRYLPGEISSRDSLYAVTPRWRYF
jgi:hypothetical protein